MTILLINRNYSVIRYPAEMISIYNMYLIAKTAMFSTSLTEMADTYSTRNKWKDFMIIGSYFGIYESKTDAKEERVLSLMKNAKATAAKKHKSKLDLMLIQQFKNIMNTFKKDVVKYYEYFLKGNGLLNWIDLLNTEEAYYIGYDDYWERNKKEDVMIKLICEVLVGNIALLMFAGNVGDFMKEHALDKIDINKPGSYSCDFYSFPLFHIPFKKPDIDNDPLSAETMIQIRKHLQGKVNTISDKIVEFNIAIRADDFCQLTEHKTLEFYESIKTDETLFQEHVDNEIYLQQMKNSTNKWYNVEWRVGVMQLDKIPEYFEKARILLPFVAGALKNKLEMQLDAAKGEVFLYCKLPEQEFEEIEELYRIKWKDKGLL